jgi:hypothetical protein
MHEGTPGWTRWSAAVLALLGSSCAKTYTVLDLGCGPLSLRFQQTRRPTLTSLSPWTESLLVGRPSGWVELDIAVPDGPYPPETFSRVLGPALGFRHLPVVEDERLPRFPWTVYVDPAVVSRAEYDTIVSCFERHAAAVDRAAVTRALDLGIGTAPRMTSVLHARRDGEHGLCVREKVLGTRWDCADGKAYIKTSPGRWQGQLLLCRIDTPSAIDASPPEGAGMMTLGRLSDDQKTVFLATPDSYEAPLILHGQEPRTYYATCRDAAGRGFFDVFSPSPDGPAFAGKAGNTGR